MYGLEKKYWDSLIKNELKPLTNKAISGLYPPGSTIKTLVALSALENGIIKPLDTFSCKGKIELYGEKFHCWERWTWDRKFEKAYKDLAMYISMKSQEN